MIEIEFLYIWNNNTIIQANYTDKFKDVLQKLRFKLNMNLNSVHYLYNGTIITNINLTINEIIKSFDKQNNKMSIQIIDLEKNEENDINIKTKQVICPQCKTIAKMDINNYRIRIYNCINNHDIKNILLENFEKDQKINISKIICDECKNRNKGNSYKQIFYRCITCKLNLCPIYKEKHDDNHGIINYDDINYICEKHNYTYSFYCKNCKKNICILCEKEHENHEIMSYGKIIPNKEEIKNNLNIFKNKIGIFNKEINDIIDNLINVVDNIGILYNIFENIIKMNNYKNYEMIQNLNDINININKYTKDLDEISEEKYLNKKFEKIIKIYANIKNKNINEYLDLFKNNNINNYNNMNNFNMNFNNFNNLKSQNFQNDLLYMNNNINNINLNNNYNNNNNFNIMNKNFNLNNNMNNNMLNNNIFKDDTIFVSFTFKRNNKQIYIDINPNKTFLDAIKMLEKKYNLSFVIPKNKFYFKKKEITTDKFTKKLKQLYIEDSSDISILD